MPVLSKRDKLIAAPHITPDFPKGTYLDNFVKFITTYYKIHAITIDARELAGNDMVLGKFYGSEYPVYIS